MSKNDFIQFENQDELSETYSLYLANQYLITSYPIQFIQTRNQMIEWIIFLCHHLNFKNETLFKAISLFDIYISKSQNTENIYSIDSVKLIAIACFSLATKIEEINCNFLNFFTENVLNAGNCQPIYTSKLLAKKEMQILQKLNFKTNQTTCYQFLNIYQQLFANIFKNNQTFSFISQVCEHFLKNLIKDNNVIFMNPSDIAFIAVQQTISHISQQQLNNETNFYIFTFINQIQNMFGSYHKANNYNNNNNCLFVQNKSMCIPLRNY